VREASGDPYIPLITTVPVAFTEDEGRRFIERQWNRAEQGTGYSFAIADGDTDHAVGQIGLWLKDISERRASIGYWVIRSARGRQAAAHSLRALALWAFHDLQIPRRHLYAEPWNTASIMTAERAGFVREGLLRDWQEVDGARKDMYMYARLPVCPATRCHWASDGMRGSGCARRVAAGPAAKAARPPRARPGAAARSVAALIKYGSTRQCLKLRPSRCKLAAGRSMRVNMAGQQAEEGP
jgi:RimJ/RimL family protein N-acetyltransferase